MKLKAELVSLPGPAVAAIAAGCHQSRKKIIAITYHRKHVTSAHLEYQIRFSSRVENCWSQAFASHSGPRVEELAEKRTEECGLCAGECW
jgi:hypothetical protein